MKDILWQRWSGRRETAVRQPSRNNISPSRRGLVIKNLKHPSDHSLPPQARRRGSVSDAVHRQELTKSCSQKEQITSNNRRHSLVIITSLALLSPSARASSDQFTTYTDPQDGFTISVPSDWLLGSGNALGAPTTQQEPRRSSIYSNAAGLQRVIAWVPPTTTDVNVAITVRTPSADFTGLGSFGTAQTWAESLVASMDRSSTKRIVQSGRGMFQSNSEPVTTAKLLDYAETDKNRYVVKYIVSREGSPTRIVISAVAFGELPNGIRRFYTVNGSCTEDTQSEFGDTLQKMVDSFKVT